MARYIVNSAKFNPIDFETRVAPLKEYIDAYDKQYEALDELGVLSDTVGGMLDPKRDEALYQSYRNYQDLLNSTVDNMVSSGNLNSARNNFSILRKKYANEINPILQGYTAWQKAIDSYDTQKAKDPTFIGTDPRQYTTSNYMKGNSPADHSVSGASLYAMGQTDAKAASARRKLFGEWGLDENLGGQYFSRAIVEGWSQKELEKALSYGIVQSGGKLPNNAELSSAVSYLYDAYNRIANTYEIDRFRDKNGAITDKYAQAGNFILNGILSGIQYDIDEKALKNENFLNPLERARLAGEALDNEYKRIRNYKAAYPDSDSDSTSTRTGTFSTGDVTITDKKAFNKASRLLSVNEGGSQQLGYADTIVENPAVKGTYTTTTQLDLEDQLNDLRAKFENTHNYSKVEPAPTIGNTFDRTKAVTYNKVDKNGKVVGKATQAEYNEYQNYVTKERQIQQSIDKESEELSKVMGKYGYLKTSGMSMADAVVLGARIDKQRASDRFVTRTPLAVSSDFSNEKQRFSQMIGDAPEGAFKGMNGSAISSNDYKKKIKGTATDDIISITEVVGSNRGLSGYKITTKDYPDGFIFTPNTSVDINHRRLLDKASTILTDYSPEAIVPLKEYSSVTDAVFDIVTRNRDIIHSKNRESPEVKVVQDYRRPDSGLFVLSYKDSSYGPSKILVEVNNGTPEVISYTNIVDYGTEMEGVYNALGEISDKNFEYLTGK